MYDPAIASATGSLSPVIMADHVTTADGFTYERTAISEWLRTNDTSPSTGAKLESRSLFPNLSLRSIIRSYVEA